MSRETLSPVSFHLRNFNNYISLDMPASQNGNLTLIGENAAGKTTLANCFFPMLIDGSIATPSFNPAKGTDRLDKTTTRNSANDTRNFEGMLLGWGSGAMKVRTGYSYMLMRSQKRQAIIGIGAHRAVGESTSKGATWWFVAISDDLSKTLKVVTTNDNGKSLEKKEFVELNENSDANLEVFTQLSEFQNYVSDKIYGFTNPKSLNQLATTYRLLASPILTAGNARLTPILNAMKNAQEGIDNQIIEFVADTQREVNSKKAILERLTRAATRLGKLKTEIFWRNLNRLQELTLEPYSSNDKKLSGQKNSRDNYKNELTSTTQQLELLQPLLQQAEQQTQQLRDKLAEQKSIEKIRESKKIEIDQLLRDLHDYDNLTARFKKQEAKLAEYQKEMADLVDTQNDLYKEVQPIQAVFAKEALRIGPLKEELAKADLKEQVAGLGHYLRKIKGLLVDYKNILDNQNHLSEDVQIVSEIRVNMDEKIDLRTNGLVVGRIRSGLHSDNKDVHNAGAAKMNVRYAELEQQRLNLLEINPDLESFLDDQNLWQSLKDNLTKLVKINQELTELNNKIDKQQDKINFAQKETDESKEVLQTKYLNFDVDLQNQKVSRLRTEMEALVIDPHLKEKIAQAKATQNKYRESERNLGSQKAELLTKIANTDDRIKDLNGILQELAQQTENNLKILAPYEIDDYDLNTINDVLEFLSQNRSMIRTNSFSELSDKIGRLIHNNNENGIDPYALDDIFEDRGYPEIASSMRKERSINQGDLRVVPFDIKQAEKIIVADKSAVEKSLEQLNTGNEAAQMTYIEAAVHQISDQYDLVDGYNKMLAHGVQKSQGIQLKVTLDPDGVDEQVISEARDVTLSKRPELLKEIQRRLERLANNVQVSGDEEAFMEEAYQLLDIRQWSKFNIWIHRKQAESGDFELVDDKFVQSGGSGAEKAQAMVLPLLLVPKMVLHRSKKSDAPHLVMFDEFADKLDPETAKSFAKTIDHFGFNFIATMPSGAQNKILADGVENIAYDVIAPVKKNDGKFHKNTVREAVIWREA